MSATSIALVAGTAILLFVLRWLRPSPRHSHEEEAAGQEIDRLARFLDEAEADRARLRRALQEIHDWYPPAVNLLQPFADRALRIADEALNNEAAPAARSRTTQSIDDLEPDSERTKDRLSTNESGNPG